MILNHRKSLAQNFVAKAHLAVTLVNGSSISPNDTVYEIGPGKGRLTRELAKKAKKVIAIEKDSVLSAALKKTFEHYDNIIIHNADFLKFKIKEPHYKVFSNVPFNITSAVMRKILYAGNPPAEAYLILQKEAAEKLTGCGKTTQSSVLAKPWFKFRISHFLRRTDFSPVPKVDVVMLHIEKRLCPLILREDISIYEIFIRCGFNTWRKNLKLNYKGILSHNQWKKLSRDLEFSIHAKPSELKFWQWLGLFEFCRKNIYRYKAAVRCWPYTHDATIKSLKNEQTNACPLGLLKESPETAGKRRGHAREIALRNLHFIKREQPDRVNRRVWIYAIGNRQH